MKGSIKTHQIKENGGAIFGRFTSPGAIDVRQNFAKESGGAIYAFGGSSIKLSMVQSNSAHLGGGLYISGTSVNETKIYGQSKSTSDT